MKTLLIHHDPNIAKRKEDVVPYPPLGLASIAAVLRENNLDVEILDSCALNLNIREVKKAIEKSNADIIGVTCWTPALNSMYEITMIAKEVLPNSIVVVGGPHMSIYPKETMSYPFIDVGVIGEGEYTMLELVKKCSKSEDTENVLGTVIKIKNKVKMNEQRPLIKNIDELPLPARDLLPNDLYVDSNGNKWTSMITIRGCPYKCAFCLKTFWDQKIRQRSANKVIEEMKECREKLGIKIIRVYDETFTLNKRRVIEICKGIIEEGLDIEWSVSSRVNIIDRDIIEALHKAGCNTIFFGVESGDQRILDLMKKGITLQQCRGAFKICKDVGMKTVAYFMIGYPGENKHTIEKTINFAKELYPDDVKFNITTAYPRTELYQLALKEGYIKGDYWEKRVQKDNLAKDRFDQFMRAPYCITDELTEDVLNYYLKKAYKKFYLRPSFIFKKLLNIRNFKQFGLYSSYFLNLLRK